MSDIPFHLTRAGSRFYESTVPALVQELERLNENLERLINLQHKKETENESEDRTEEGTQPPVG